MTPQKQYVLITGGSSGIGAAAARRFASQGAAVAIVARRPEPINDIVKEIHAMGTEALGIPADLQDPDSPKRVMEVIAREWGRLDILVNDAAVVKHFPFEQAPRDVFEMHWAVNVRAPYFLIQAALPLLKKSPSATVINISSSSGSLAIPGQSMYGSSKCALEYLTRSLASELAPLGIRVNAIAPGPTDTPIHLTWAGDDVKGAYERMTKELPLGRMGTADELGAWITWLASPESSWVTGVVIAVDGGQVLPGAMSRIAK
jgi:NAD(P)-dependent dehydrogenase (short-subunit alcohol dehydrogenase family)